MKMKFAALCFVLFAFIAPSAFADESPLAGIYVGGHLGITNLTANNEDPDCFYECSAYSLRDTGLGLGLLAGQNFVSGNLLFGYLADLTGAVGTSKSFTYDNFGPTDYAKTSAKFKGAFSLRAKAGLVVNDTAISLSFGPALGKFESSFYFPNVCCTPGSAAGSKQDGTVSGWVYGLGVEHAIKTNLIAGFDWSHYTFQDKKEGISYTNGLPYLYSSVYQPVNKFTNTVDTARVTVSYKF